LVDKAPRLSLSGPSRLAGIILGNPLSENNEVHKRIIVPDEMVKSFTFTPLHEDLGNVTGPGPSVIADNIGMVETVK
jgi:hypothetical protein